MTLTPAELTSAVSGGIGTSPQRPDGNLKVRGEFAYASDLWHEDMIWGATLRSPHPYARIASVDLTEALKVPGVYAVLTHEDVPGRNLYGLEHKDQPVLAVDVVRYQGEPVALVGADHPETALRAMKKIVVDVRRARTRGGHGDRGRRRSRCIPAGTWCGTCRSGAATQDADADVVVTGRYEVGMQDQAFLGPESGLAVPADDGGVDLYIATQWLHVDRGQVGVALGLPEEKVRLTLSGVGGAFGGREDLSMQVHACLLALHTGKPVEDGLQPRGVVLRPRAPAPGGAVLRARRRPATASSSTSGRGMYLDGGAYASSTPAVVVATRPRWASVRTRSTT